MRAEDCRTYAEATRKNELNPKDTLRKFTQHNSLS